MAWVSLVILLSLLEYSLLGALVSRACGQFGIKRLPPPAIRSSSVTSMYSRTRSKVSSS